MYYILGFRQRRNAAAHLVCPLIQSAYKIRLYEHWNSRIVLHLLSRLQHFSKQVPCHLNLVCYIILYSIPPRISFISLLKKSSIRKLVLSEVPCPHIICLAFAFCFRCYWGRDWWYFCLFLLLDLDFGLIRTIAFASSWMRMQMRIANVSVAVAISSVFFDPGLRFLLHRKHNTADFFFFAEALGWSCDFNGVE